MKKVRWIVCIYFVIACALFGAAVFRNRMSQDRNMPVITCDSDTLTVSVSASEEELLAGVTAADEEDGDLTAEIRIASLSNMIGSGTRTIRYVVFDAANHAATAERKLVYSDYTPPRITSSTALRFSLKECDNRTLLAGMSAQDCLDGDLSREIRCIYSDQYYYAEAGTYPITFQVNNSAGDVCSVTAELTLTGESAEEQARCYPVLSDYIVYTKAGESIDPGSYLTGLVQGGREMGFSETAGISASDIRIESAVDYGQPGTYAVSYSYTTPEGITGITKLFVVVEA